MTASPRALATPDYIRRNSCRRNGANATVYTAEEYREILRKEYGLPAEWKPDGGRARDDNLDPTQAQLPHGADQPDDYGLGDLASVDAEADE
jgi:hypothetical protein